MKKLLIAAAFLISGIFVFADDLMAKNVTALAANKEQLDDSISYLKSQVTKMNLPAEKRAVYIFLASLQEQSAMFSDAQASYALAAGIAAGDAEGMPKKSNEQLVLDAVRCALSSGDWETADIYLNSAVRNSKNSRVQAYIKLYTQWSALCKAETVEDLNEPIVMLQAYQKIENLSYIQPSVLLTLWYITGEKSYSKEITGRFPNSIEAAIVNGDVQLLPTPFWFFVPKKGEAEQGTGTYNGSDFSDKNSGSGVVAGAGEGKVVAAGNGTGGGAGGQVQSQAAGKSSASEKSAVSKLQVGLFRTESNAELLKKELISKGFEAYVTNEKRASGTTYFIVLVDDKSGNTADKLRSNGYECYVVD